MTTGRVTVTNSTVRQSTSLMEIQEGMLRVQCTVPKPVRDIRHHVDNHHAQEWTQDFRKGGMGILPEGVTPVRNARMYVLGV